jgi:hypothetical protein
VIMTVPVKLAPGTFYRFYLGYPDAFGFKDQSGVGMRSVEYTFTTGPARN